MYRLPPPDADPVTGAYDVYFVKDVATTAETFADHDTSFGGFDRRSAFTLVDSGEHDSCARRTLLRAELLRAAVMRVAPATDTASARAMTTYLSRLSLACAAPLDFRCFDVPGQSELGRA